MKANRAGYARSKSPPGGKKASSAGSESAHEVCNKEVGSKGPQGRPVQPDGAGKVEAEVLAICMQLQEEINQHERQMSALKRSHAIELNRCFANFTNKNNELKANAALRVECRKTYDGYKQLQIENHGLKQIIKRQEARSKESDHSHAGSPTSLSWAAATPSQDAAGAAGEDAGKRSSSASAKGEAGSRLSTTEVTMLH